MANVDTADEIASQMGTHTERIIASMLREFLRSGPKQNSSQHTPLKQHISDFLSEYQKAAPYDLGETFRFKRRPSDIVQEAERLGLYAPALPPALIMEPNNEMTTFPFRINTVEWDPEANLFKNAFDKVGIQYVALPCGDSAIEFHFSPQDATRVQKTIDYMCDNVKGVGFHRFPDYERLTNTNQVVPPIEVTAHVYKSMIINNPQELNDITAYLTDKGVNYSVTVDADKTELAVDVTELELNTPADELLEHDVQHTLNVAKTQNIKGVSKASMDKPKQGRTYGLNQSQVKKGRNHNQKSTPKKDRDLLNKARTHTQIIDPKKKAIGVQTR